MARIFEWKGMGWLYAAKTRGLVDFIMGAHGQQIDFFFLRLRVYGKLKQDAIIVIHSTSPHTR